MLGQQTLESCLGLRTVKEEKHRERADTSIFEMLRRICVWRSLVNTGLTINPGLKAFIYHFKVAQQHLNKCFL